MNIRGKQSMEAVGYLNLLHRHGKKSFEWWGDDSLQQAHTTPYLTVQPPYGKVGVWIAAPSDQWLRAADVAKFLDIFRKSIGNDAPVLKAQIVVDRRQCVYLYWHEDAKFWAECEKIMSNWRRMKTPTAKVISMCL
jgi:hypothetical protein